ncbi:hypothetical protein DFH94DRAFT_726025, partial [Russula ochroleuca]
MTLLACLQGMPCLRRLVLSIEFISRGSQLQHSSPNDIVPLSKLTLFHYLGTDVFLDVLLAGLSAPSLRDFDIDFCVTIWPPVIVHFSRFIGEIEKHSHIVYVEFQDRDFYLSLLAQSEYISHFRLHFRLHPVRITSPESMMSILLVSDALSTKFVTVEELRVNLDQMDIWVDNIPWRRFLQRFPNVKVLRTEGAKRDCIATIARRLLQGHEGPNDDLAFLPSLEVIELDKSPFLESQHGPELAAHQQKIWVQPVLPDATWHLIALVAPNFFA